MKQFLLYLLLLFLLGCSKNNSVDPITERSSILVSSFGKWRLTALKLAATNVTLTPTQLVYTKRYTPDYKFSDSDGLVGTWSMPSANQLIEVFTNFSSGISVTQEYTILGITPTQLNLSYTVNGTEITAIYTASM